jgi:hypothetical protein
MDCFVASLLAMTELAVEAECKAEKGLRDHLAQPFVFRP